MDLNRMKRITLDVYPDLKTMLDCTSEELLNHVMKECAREDVDRVKIVVKLFKSRKLHPDMGGDPVIASALSKLKDIFQLYGDETTSFLEKLFHHAKQIQSMPGNDDYSNILAYYRRLQQSTSTAVTHHGPTNTNDHVLHSSVLDLSTEASSFQSTLKFEMPREARHSMKFVKPKSKVFVKMGKSCMSKPKPTCPQAKRQPAKSPPEKRKPASPPEKRQPAKSI